jgi:hypothetical protein
MATAIDQVIASAGIGHNSSDEPAAPTPYEAIKLHIDDLMETAQGFLDGTPIASQADADMVAKVLDDARKARAAAEAQRKLEAKPFDDGKAAVQALWTPLTDDKKGRCALIAETCKQALAPWEEAQAAERRAAAEAAKREAEEKAAAARAAIQTAPVTDLAARDRAEALLKDAGRAERAALKLENARSETKVGGRAVSLRSVWTPTLSDPIEALRHYRAKEPEALKVWLLDQALADVRAGCRTIPGFTIEESKAAQ